MRTERSTPVASRGFCQHRPLTTMIGGLQAMENEMSGK